MRADRIQLLKSFIQEEPNDPFNKYALGMEYISDNLLEDGELFFSELLEKHPDYLPTYYQAAHLYWQLNETSKAESIFTTGIELAEKQQDLKAISELKSAYQNFLFEIE